MRKGIFFVVSAPSGTGKTTLCKRVLERTDNLHFTVSYTTRKPRPHEVNGREYNFVDEATFRRMIAEGKFAEYANVYGNLYGTSLDELESNCRAGRDLLIEIDVQGARNIKARFSEAVLIFLHPPSLADLRRRLEGRGTDASDVIEQRLGVATQELAQMQYYDYLIENRDLEAAVTDFLAIIRTERLRCARVLPEIVARFPGVF